MDLLCAIIAQLPGDVVLVPFIIYSGTVTKLATFMSSVEQKAWVTLEQCILKMLKNSPVLMVQIVSEQNEIYSGHKQCLKRPELVGIVRSTSK
jgi:hypothetical protein